MFSNDILNFMMYLRGLPEEKFVTIITVMQVIVIIIEIIAFFYIRKITEV